MMNQQSKFAPVIGNDGLTTWLHRRNACAEGIAWAVGKSWREAIQECPRADWLKWAIRKLIADGVIALEAYDAANCKAEDVYDAAVYMALEAYNAAMLVAENAYDATMRSAREAYQTAQREAEEAYNAAVCPARKAYQIARREALKARDAHLKHWLLRTLPSSVYSGSNRVEGES